MPVAAPGKRCPLASRHHRFQNIEEPDAARIERGEGYLAAVRDDFHRRVDETEIPARIAVGVLDAGRKIGAAAGIQALDEMGDADGEIEAGGAARDLDPALSGEGVGHDGSRMTAQTGPVQAVTAGITLTDGKKGERWETSKVTLYHRNPTNSGNSWGTEKIPWRWLALRELTRKLAPVQPHG